MVHANGNSTISQVNDLQRKTAPLPEYSVRGHEAWWGTTTSGLIGTIFTLIIVWLIARYLQTAKQLPPPSATQDQHG